MEFPHLNTKGDFPGVSGVNVYKYDNELDYGRYDYNQMDVQVCRVPWDMGEAHVGQRTITGIGNVVYFETAQRRDEWFEAIPDSECFRWATKFKELHRDMRINVPLPFDIAARYNYVRVKYHLFANDNSTLEYESDSGVREWFYFIREVNFVAPNTTELVLMDDAWQTWIYDVNITGMVLERGHAPLFRTPADTYLANPIANNDGLLTEDVNYGELQQVASSDVLKLNDDDVYMCIATSSGDPWLDWGKQGAKWSDADWDAKRGDWVTRAAMHTATSRVPEYRVLACPPSSYNELFEALDAQIPQFIQTIQGIFFVERKYLVFGNTDNTAQWVKDDGSFKLAGVTVYWVRRGTDATVDFTALTKDRFGYPANYQDLAKLYTYPYSAIEVSDENGNTTLVKVEDTTGKIQANVACNLAFPFISLDANLTGIGGSKQANVKFANLSEDSRNFSGRWYEHVRSWDIPCFLVIIEASKVNEYDEYFDRMQKRVEYENAYTRAGNDAALARRNNLELNDAWENSVDKENAVQKSNTDNQAEKEHANERAQTKAMGDNKTLEVTYRNSRTNTNNDFLDTQNAANANIDFMEASTDDFTSTSKGLNNLKLEADIVVDNTFAGFSTIAETSAIGTLANISGVSSIVQGGMSGATNAALSGAAPLAPIMGAVGVASGVINGASAVASSNIVISKENTLTNQSMEQNRTKGKFAYHYNTAMNGATKTFNRNITSLENNVYSNTTDNNIGAMDKQADNTYGDSGWMKVNANNLKSTRDTYNNITSRAKQNTYNRTYNYTYKNNQVISDNGNLPNRGNLEGDKTNAWLARDTARNAIINRQDQKKLEAPKVFGQVANAQTATTRPMALFANVVTQSDSAIANAGDEFLRYGYEYERQWNFDGNWNIGAHFTYWKLSDFWVRGLQVPDLYMDKIRFFLYGGVTVWRKPEDIGNITIYDNWTEKSA